MDALQRDLSRRLVRPYATFTGTADAQGVVSVPPAQYTARPEERDVHTSHTIKVVRDGKQIAQDEVTVDQPRELNLQQRDLSTKSRER